MKTSQEDIEKWREDIMDPTLTDILWYVFIGGVFFMMMRKGCCCGGHRHKKEGDKSDNEKLTNNK